MFFFSLGPLQDPCDTGHLRRTNKRNHLAAVHSVSILVGSKLYKYHLRLKSCSFWFQGIAIDVKRWPQQLYPQKHIVRLGACGSSSFVCYLSCFHRVSNPIHHRQSTLNVQSWVTEKLSAFSLSNNVEVEMKRRPNDLSNLDSSFVWVGVEGGAPQHSSRS